MNAIVLHEFSVCSPTCQKHPRSDPHQMFEANPSYFHPQLAIFPTSNYNYSRHVASSSCCLITKRKGTRSLCCPKMIKVLA
uniref:Uncharacterized protein n=1 Tax=Rhizophora mucronata TaxID=61149 RepID=A0A2P2P501_RHIMU